MSRPVLEVIEAAAEHAFELAAEHDYSPNFARELTEARNRVNVLIRAALAGAL